MERNEENIDHGLERAKIVLRIIDEMNENDILIKELTEMMDFVESVESEEDDLELNMEIEEEQAIDEIVSTINSKGMVEEIIRRMDPLLITEETVYAVLKAYGLDDKTIRSMECMTFPERLVPHVLPDQGQDNSKESIDSEKVERLMSDLDDLVKIVRERGLDPEEVIKLAQSMDGNEEYEDDDRLRSALKVFGLGEKSIESMVRKLSPDKSAK